MLSIFKRRRAINLLVLGTLLLILSGVRSIAQTTAAPKIFAQKLVEEALAAHPELMGLEIAAAPPGKAQCVTIASNEIKGIGEKCDKDEFIAMKTNKPFVEKEKESGKEVYDVTVAIHDINGKIIGTAGIDFKPRAGQTGAEVTQRSLQIAKELESQLRSKKQLFELIS